MVNAEALFNKLVKELADVGIENSSFETELVFSKCIGKDFRRIRFLKEPYQIDDIAEEEIISIIEKRKKHIPLQYLLGEWEFYGIEFKVGEGVLIPRQDTETLVDCALEFLAGDFDVKILDLCSGSGCVPIAIEKNCLGLYEIYGIEKSEKAYSYFKENVRLNESKVKPVLGDVFNSKIIAEFDNDFELITSNPPYLTDDDMKNLQKEVEFEPKMALFGGEDGLDFYRKITSLWKDKLKIGGALMFEVGFGQADDVCDILKSNGFGDIEVKRDLCGVERVVKGRKLR